MESLRQLTVSENLTKTTESQTGNDETQALRQQIKEAIVKFHRASKQVSLLKRKIGELRKRYAKAEGSRTFRYSYFLQITSAEGMLNTYMEYTRMQAVKIARLKEDMYWAKKYEESSDDSDDDDDELI